jgi:hypothetical protein
MQQGRVVRRGGGRGADGSSREERREEGREAEGSGRPVRSKFFDARELWEEQEEAAVLREETCNTYNERWLRDASGRVAAVLSYEVVRDHYALGAYFDVTVQSGRFF